MKKGIFSIAIAGLALIIILYAISQHNINQEYTKTHSITSTAYIFETKTNNMIRLLDKALADAYNEEHAIGNCNDNGQVKNRAEELFNKIMDTLKNEYKINCQTQDKKIVFNAGRNLTATPEIICTYNNGDIKITRTLQIKLEKEGEQVGVPPNTDCQIKDTISNCIEQPNFSCP
ncbi:MAG: hypothetical protein QXU92_00860 [Candidatus Diapherotrites archaeon]